MAEGVYPLLNVSSLEKSIEFYKGLGLEVGVIEDEGMRWAEVSSGEGAMLLYPKTGTPDMDMPEDTRSWLSGELGKGVLVTIGVPDAAACHEKALAMSATIDMALEDAPWGGQHFSVVDPDGYVISLSDKIPG